MTDGMVSTRRSDGARGLERHSRIPVRYEAEVVVVGGGAAGVAAAVSAARAGSETILVERDGFLGGTMTATSLGGICGLYSLIDGEPVQMVYGFAEEVKERLIASGASTGPLAWLQTASFPYDHYLLKAIFDEMVALPNLKVLLHAGLTGVVRDGDRLTHVTVRDRAREWAIQARVFIDCTGDAVLSEDAGVDTHYDPRSIQFPTTMFRMGGVDIETASRISRPEMHEILERAVEAGFDLPRTAGGIYPIKPGIVHLNITRISIDGRPPDVFDPDELTYAEMEGRRQASLYLEAFRKFVPGYENAFIVDTGSQIGLRETRRIDGRAVVSSDDVLSEAKYDDAIACNVWPIEQHGVGRSVRWVWLSPGGYNHIRYGTMLPKEISNLLVAGRCISASADAQAAIRITANCFSLGQAAGIAAARTDARGDTSSVSIPLLQSALSDAGAQLKPN